MTALEILALANGAIGIAFQLYNAAKQIAGEAEIPSWESIVNENALLQSKIDAEKG